MSIGPDEMSLVPPIQDESLRDGPIDANEDSEDGPLWSPYKKYWDEDPASADKPLWNPFHD